MDTARRTNIKNHHYKNPIYTSYASSYFIATPRKSEGALVLAAQDFRRPLATASRGSRFSGDRHGAAPKIFDSYLEMMHMYYILSFLLVAIISYAPF